MTGRSRHIRERQGAGSEAATVRVLSVILCLFGLVFAGSAPVIGEEVTGSLSGSISSCLDGRAERVEIVSRDKDGIFLDSEGQRYFAADLQGFGQGTASAQLDDLAGPEGRIRLLAVPLGKPNRWGMIPAWVVIQGDSAESLLQEELLKSGKAMFAPALASHDCADLLRNAEHIARQSETGMWGGREDAGIFQASALKSFEGKAGRYIIVRGRIVSLGKSRSTRYLNFGRYWKTDLTVTLKSSDEDRFNELLARFGWRIEDLAGQYVEIRGVLQEKDGPFIALRHPEQLMVLERKRAGRGGQYSN